MPLPLSEGIDRVRPTARWFARVVPSLAPPPAGTVTPLGLTHHPPCLMNILPSLLLLTLPTVPQLLDPTCLDFPGPPPLSPHPPSHYHVLKLFQQTFKSGHTQMASPTHFPGLPITLAHPPRPGLLSPCQLKFFQPSPESNHTHLSPLTRLDPPIHTCPKLTSVSLLL